MEKGIARLWLLRRLRIIQGEGEHLGGARGLGAPGREGVGGEGIPHAGGREADIRLGLEGPENKYATI